MSKPCCPECGRPLPAGSLDGSCPHCLLALGVPAGTSGASPSAPQAGPAPGNAACEAPGQRIARYQLLEAIGEGGFGTVWMAEQTEPVRRKVALKIIKLGMDTTEVIARFEAERQALAMMDHPNIARVFDGGATENGRPYFVMELVKGVCITDYCDANRLSTEARLKLFMQVCEAVQHAHQKGVIHRDLKPGNILVTEQDGRPAPKVIDFGVAKAIEEPLTDKTLFTRFHQFLGTPAYMSPEQAGLGGLDVDTRSDIYSLGVLLYELLTGLTPFSNEELLKAGLDQVMRIIREKDPPKPSTQLSTLSEADLLTVAQRRASQPARLNRLVRGELDWVVMKCLEKDRVRRYETANAFAQDLERFLDHQPVSAVAPSLAYEFTKFARRNRIALVTSSAFVLLLVISTVISTRQAVRANRERDRAEFQRSRSDALLLKMNIARAEEWFAATNKPNGIALLAQILRSSPTNRAVAERLINELSPLSFGLAILDSMRHAGRVTSVSFSPDGKRIASASQDRSARIWDAATGAEVGWPLIHDQPVVATSFSQDGSKLLTICEDKKARLWTADTGQLLFTVPDERAMRITEYNWEGHFLLSVTGETVTVWDVSQAPKQIGSVSAGETITHAKASRDGSKLVTVSTNQTVQVWNTRSGVPLGHALRHRELLPAVNTVEFSPDAQRIVTGADDGTVRIWNTSTGETVAQPWRHDNKVVCVRWAEDGTRFVTSSWDHTAQVWDAAGNAIGQRMRHNSFVQFAAFSPQGDAVVTTSSDQTARIWDADTGFPITGPLSHDNSVDGAEFSPDGQRIVTVGRDEFVRVWPANEGAIFSASLHQGSNVADTRFSPDGRKVVTTSSIGTARIWDADTAEAITEPVMQGGDVVSSAFSPDSSRFIVAGTGGTAGIRDVRTGKLTAPLLEHARTIRSTDFSPDGKCVATASDDETAVIWNVVTGEKIHTLSHPADVSRVFYSPNGRMVLTVCGDTRARLWDAATGQVIGRPLEHGAPYVTAFFSGDSQFVVSTAFETLVRTWSTATGEQIGPAINLERAGLFTAFSPNVKWVAATSSDQLLHVWDRQTGQPLNDGIKFIDAQIYYIQFDPAAGLRILAVAANQFRVFDAASGLAVSESFHHDGSIHRARFSADGQRIVSGSVDGTARIWEVPPAASPAPAWLPELAETLVRQRFDDGGRRDLVRSTGLAELRSRILATAIDDYYGHWARWFFAGPSERTISPFSPIRVEDFVSKRIQESTAAGLCEALTLAPTNTAALAQLVQAVLDKKQPASMILLHKLQISRHLRRAGRLTPGEPKVWQAQARVLDLAGQLPDALKMLDRALALKASDPDLLAAKAEVLVRMVRNPARPQGARSNELDLSLFYDGSVHDGLHDAKGKPDRGMSGLPIGLQTFGGVRFDVRGTVQLRGTENKRPLPQSATNIPVQLKFERLHALMATGWSETEGKRIGTFMLHYVDGQQAELPIRYAVHVRDCLAQPKPGEDNDEPLAAASVVWTGANELSRQLNGHMRLYNATWENPRPGVPVQSLDFRSDVTRCAPFVIALTVE